MTEDKGSLTHPSMLESMALPEKTFAKSGFAKVAWSRPISSAISDDFATR